MGTGETYKFSLLFYPAKPKKETGTRNTKPNKTKRSQTKPNKTKPTMNDANIMADHPSDGLPDLTMSTSEQRAAYAETALLTVPEKLENNARLAPGTTAVILGSQTLSYAQLNEKANQLAAYLVQAGVQRETLVCICLPQSVEKVVSMLAVLKAGGAYVPVDPNYPASRIHFILKDSAAPFMITTAPLSQKITTNSHMIFMDDPATLSILAGMPDCDHSSYPAMSDLAYIIYTSGSTGQPKGVMIEHRSFSVFTAQHTRVLGITEKDRTLQFSSTSFDAAVIDLWIPLLAGATLFLYPDNRIMGAPLLEFIQEHKISILPLIAPTVLASLPLHDDTGCLKVIGIGGEVCPAHTLQYWSEKVRLINSYGPTEATVAVTSYVCKAGDSPKIIGKGSPAAKLYLLDENRQEVATGATGELYIGGTQIARGYLNRQELNLEKFVPDPLAAAGNVHSRLYRTGDLMYRMPDGNFAFSGRIDDQVKIRGYRIELGEVENTLNQLKGIHQAVVLPRDNEQGQSILAAFIVCEKQQENITAISRELRKQLQQILPAYMVPERFELLSSMPLNAHGKIDKDRLQLTLLPVSDNISLTVIDPADYENIICAVWGRFLQSGQLAYQDNFFESGGDSIMLMQVYAALPDSLKKNMLIPDFYTYPNAKSLATEIRNREHRALISEEEKRTDHHQGIAGRCPA